MFVNIIFNFVIKIAASGDLSLINDFLSKIRGIIESPDSQKNVLYNEIINNHYFLQFILDSYLQLYILDNNKDPNKKFIPSFSLDLYKTSPLEEKELPLTETAKKDIIKKALNNCEKIILYNLTENITNFDYVLTWGKYYEKIKEENDIYNYALKQGVKLSIDEVRVIYMYIKNYWQVFYKEDATYLLDELKDKLSANAYNKICELYKKYKK